MGGAPRTKLSFPEKLSDFSEDVWDAFCTPALRPCLIAWNYGA
jgi:hypothetical protein